MSALNDADKEAIRSAYNAMLEARGLTPRWGQRQMIAEVARTFARVGADDTPVPHNESHNESHNEPDREPNSAATAPIALIEAGTGTGKTLAYVIPALVMARARAKRLVLATATVALQEQLVHKDLPDIRSGSGLAFDFALAKGRRRYLCLSQLDRHLAGAGGRNLDLYPDAMAVALERTTLDTYAAMLDALSRGDWDGDRDKWPQSIDERDWLPLTLDRGQCTGRRCPNIGNCSVYRAREGLQEADIIVTNHDLVLADLNLGGGVVLPAPQDSLYVFDEGHHLPDKALEHFASFCRLPAARTWLGEARKALAKGAPLLTRIPGLAAVLDAVPDVLDELALGLDEIDDAAAQLMAALEPGRQRLRFAGGVVPEALRPGAAAQAALWSRLLAGLNALDSGVDEALDDEDFGAQGDELEAWKMALGGMLARAEGIQALWRDYADESAADPASAAELAHPPRARWLARADEDEGAIDFHCSHILAADILQTALWSQAAGAVLTSATLTALGRFDRLQAHCGIPDQATFAVVASPFDYARATLAVPAMRSEPGNANAHTAELVELLPALLCADEGSLVLFSSRRQMNDVFDALPETWRTRILRQGDYSKQDILRRHGEAIDAGRGSAVFGLASFAEGVDLPGDYCRHVVIAKLLFSAPDQPVDAALAEWIEAQGRNAFMEISVPDAARRLVQASGRLLRTETDSGRVTLLDRRLLTRRYGRAILDSLPPFTRDFA